MEYIPQIISEAAKSQLGIWALIIVGLTGIGFYFFRSAPLAIKAGIYILMFVGFGLFGLVASRIDPASSPAKTVENNDSRKTPKAGLLLDQANRHLVASRHDQARAAYAEARTLYKQEQNRLGEANVLRGLDHLERTLGRHDPARKNFYQAAHLYGALGLIKPEKEMLEAGESVGGQIRVRTH